MKKLLLLLLFFPSLALGLNNQSTSDASGEMWGQYGQQFLSQQSRPFPDTDSVILKNLAVASGKAKSGNNAAFIYYQRSTSGINGVGDFSTREKIYFYDATFRHPMNRNPLNQKFVGKLSAAERAMMINYEYSFMEGCLNCDGGNICILAIPKTLYQLCVALLYLRQITPTIEKGDLESSYTFWSEYFYGNREIKASPEEKQKSLPQSCINATGRNRTQVLFWSINDMVLDFLKDRKIDPVGMEKSNIVDHLTRQVLQEMHLKISVLPRNESFRRTVVMRQRSRFWSTIGYKGKYLTDMEEDIATIVVQEHKTQEDSQYLGTSRYYRGGENAARGLSYSNGALGGLISDPNSGCAFNYYPLNATDLAKDDERMYVPYIPLLLTCLGEGEFHHPRVKVVVAGDTSEIPGIDSVNINNNIEYSPNTMPELCCQKEVSIQQITILSK
ncbi:MAG: hypothetical protein LBT70_04375 [Holosporaceae bacterium]|jgi:hypothetical protein|nr:hypothetical protein [Holosporaceae bacterium]